MVIKPRIEPWIIYTLLGILSTIIVVKMCITIRRHIPYKHTIDKLEVGDVLAMTSKSFMVISHIINRRTVTFHVYNFSSFKGKSMKKIKEFVKEDAKKLNYMLDYIALYDAHTGSWKPKTKGRV